MEDLTSKSFGKIRSTVNSISTMVKTLITQNRMNKCQNGKK
jgi:hypothetical protein